MGERQVEATSPEKLAESLLGGSECQRYGVLVCENTSFERLAAQSGLTGDGHLSWHPTHDDFGAPLLATKAREEAPVMVSFTDEDGVGGIAWVFPAAHGNVAGIGLDLASRGDFPFTESRMRWYQRIFTEREMGIIQAIDPHDPDLGATLLFSGKEAAFKSASQQIRHLFQAAGGKAETFGCPYFETRDIEIVLVDDASALTRGGAAAAPGELLPSLAWEARGIAHIGDGAAAFKFLGIDLVLLRFMLIDNKVLGMAVAFKGR